MNKQIQSYAAQSSTQALGPLEISRRVPEPTDVAIDILYCGVCHSDLHQARNDWGNTVYPCVPGHEIIGRVATVGADVSRFKSGDLVAVGCMVDSCRSCSSCDEGLEQYCDRGCTMTYNGIDHRHEKQITMGGYSTSIVVDHNFVLSVPENLDPAAASPLLCAGITTWSPLKQWNVGPGMKVGVIGLGGLGHMGVKFARAMGAEVVMITTSPEKAADAARLGAHEVLISKDRAAMKAQINSYDLLLDTIPVGHSLDPYLKLLKRDATIVVVGSIEPLEGFRGGQLMTKRRRIAGSAIGGIRETQEMLDFCGQHNVVADVEVIPMQQINEAYERMLTSEVKYRFVIDMASL